MARTEREQNIEQVAGIIAEGYLTQDEAEDINDGDGWTFEVRYDVEQYVSDSNYTRVECLSLSEADLQIAYQLAKVWNTGDYNLTARDLMAAKR